MALFPRARLHFGQCEARRAPAPAVLRRARACNRWMQQVHGEGSVPWMSDGGLSRAFVRKDLVIEVGLDGPTAAVLPALRRIYPLRGCASGARECAVPLVHIGRS